MAISPTDITPLTEATSVADTDLFYIVLNPSTDRKLPASTLKGYILTNVTVSGGTIDGTAIGETTPATGKFTSLEADSLDLPNLLLAPLQPSDLPNPLQISLQLKTGTTAQFAAESLGDRELGYNHESGELLIGQNGDNVPLALDQVLIPVESVSGRPGYRLPAFVGSDDTWGTAINPIDENFVLGANALDLQPFRSAIANSASGKFSIAIGLDSRVSGLSSMSIGSANTIDDLAPVAICVGNANSISAENATVVGGSNVVGTGGGGATVLGMGCTVNVSDCVVLGNNADPSTAGQVAIGYASGRQLSFIPLLIQTADTTPTDLRTLVGGPLALAADSVLSFEVEITGVQSAPSANIGQWCRRGIVINRGGTVTLSNVHTIGTDLAPSGWSIALSADSTNDALKITVTGGAATIKWMAVVRALDLRA